MKSKLPILPLTIFLFLHSLSLPLLSDVQIVADGKPVAEIVLAQDANAAMQNAAQDLQDYLQQASGAELQIVGQPSEHFKNKIFVGTNEFTAALGFKPAEFTSSGYEVYAKDNHIILSGLDRLSISLPYGMSIEESRYLADRGPKPAQFPSPRLQAWWDFCGEPFTTWQIDLGGKGSFNSEVGIFKNDDTGTWYAAIDLLEQIGLRFYAPYEDGTVIPQLKDISLPEQHLKRQATFGRREWHYHMRSNAQNLRWFKRQKSGNHKPIIYNHTTVAIYASVMQHKNHPEYLACDAEGKPFLRSYNGQPPNAGGVPRYTNPDFRRASVVLMNKLFEASPELYAVSLGPPDGGVEVDPRDLELYGEPGDTREQKASNYVWDYHVFLARELKKSHPDKFLIYDSGAGARNIPTNLKPDDPDNIIFGFAQPYSANRVLEFINRNVIETRQKWFAAYKVRGKVPIWDYFLYYRRGTNPRFPVFFTRSLQQEMQEMRPYSDGKFIEIHMAGQPRPGSGIPPHRLGEPAISHLMISWQNQLLWDPDSDREAFLDEYYNLYFGDAAAEMKTFHDFAEDVWCRQGSRSVTTTTGFLKPADIERYFELLDVAFQKTDSESVYARRIAAMQKSYEPLRNFFENIRRKGPSIEVFELPDDSQPDGDLSKYGDRWYTMVRAVTGETPSENQTRVSLAFTHDRKYFFLGVICYDKKMDKLRAVTEIPDAPSIFDDDVIELYLNSPERSFFKIVVNPKGAIWDETQDVTLIDRDTLPILWNPGTRVRVTVFEDRWEMDLCLPIADLGKTMPSKDTPWGCQVARTRFADEPYEDFRLAPGSGRYDTQNQWANIWIAEE